MSRTNKPIPDINSPKVIFANSAETFCKMKTRDKRNAARGMMDRAMSLYVASVRDIRRLDLLPRQCCGQAENALEKLADYSSFGDRPGHRHNAALCSVPMVIEVGKGKSERDLLPGEIEQIKESFRRHGLIWDEVDLQVLPWLTPVPAYEGQCLARRKLLDAITAEPGCDEVDVSSLRPDNARWEYTDSNFKAAGTTLKLRYLTLTLSAGTISTRKLVESWQHDQYKREAIDGWVAELEAIVAKRVRSPRVQACAPIISHQAEPRGYWMMAHARASRFLTNMLAAGPAPADCTFSLVASYTKEYRRLIIELTYRHGDNEIGKINIEVPFKSKSASFDLATSMADTVYAAVSSARVGTINMERLLMKLPRTEGR